MNTYRRPIKIYKANNYFRYISIILLVSLIILSLLLINLMGLVVLFIVFICITLLLILSFPRILFFHDGFSIENKFFINALSDKEYFMYSNIISVEFSPGKTDWVKLIIKLMLGNGRYGRISKDDQMIIITKDKKKRVFNRFGKLEDFKNIIAYMDSKISNP